jgi:hypothetical protein
MANQTMVLLIRIVVFSTPGLWIFCNFGCFLLIGLAALILYAGPTDIVTHSQEAIGDNGSIKQEEEYEYQIILVCNWCLHVHDHCWDKYGTG